MKPYSLATSLWLCRIRFFTEVRIQLNGEEKEIAADLTVTRLLGELGIRPGRVVVELNRDVLPRENYGTTRLQQGDTVEIVQFVGGG
ncbi:MAG: sulfur carrier protein ThiS [Candidatus Binatia bacterium]